MILGVSMIAVSEAFVLAEKLGLDHAEAVRHLVEVVGPVLVDDDLLSGAGTGAGLAGEPRLPGGLHRRDDAEGFEAAQDAAKAAGANTATRRRGDRSALFANMWASGEAARDFSGIIRFIRGGVDAAPYVRCTHVNASLCALHVTIRTCNSIQ